YFNTAVRVRTALDPEALLAVCLAVERRLGRVRAERWGARTIDLDVLWIDGEVVDSATLNVPHPGLRARAFALAPLVELLPDARDPRDGSALADALASLAPLQAPPFVLGDDAEREETEHTGDECFAVIALDRADALAASAEALANLVAETYSVQPVETHAIAIAADDLAAPLADDDRAFRWLSEVLYQLDAKRFAVRRAVVFEDGPAGVRGALLGEPLDEGRHAVRGVLEAVTCCALEAGEVAPGRYRIQVVVDE
ncbi:MAG: 2-amino-4-hydroxy-6-hydroxymethyldihydropteridine diphosphokinase, partial [Deltaproteobacteria bacterium]